MFFGEVVADGPNRKGGLQEVTDFVNHFGVKSYSPALYRDGEYHPFLPKDAKQKCYCIEEQESPALDAWVRVSPEEAAKEYVAQCYNMVPGARPALLGKYNTAGHEPNINFSSAELAGMKRRQYQFGTILNVLDLNEAEIKAFYKATACDVMLKYTNISLFLEEQIKDIIIIIMIL